MLSYLNTVGLGCVASMLIGTTAATICVGGYKTKDIVKTIEFNSCNTKLKDAEYCYATVYIQPLKGKGVLPSNVEDILEGKVK